MAPELSRNARGLQLWLPLKLIGEQAFVNCLNEKLDLAEWAAEHLRQISGLTVPDWPVRQVAHTVSVVLPWDIIRTSVLLISTPNG